jgi:hypothetical protein
MAVIADRTQVTRFAHVVIFLESEMNLPDCPIGVARLSGAQMERPMTP